MNVECPNILRAGPLTVLPERSRAAWRGQIIDLSPAEIRIIIHLLKYVNQIVTKDELCGVVHESSASGSNRSIAVLINRIRNKAFFELIITRRGLGYMIDKDNLDREALI